MKLHETRLIHRPQQEAFEYTSDFSNLASWDPGIAESKKVTDGPVGVGSRFDVIVSFGATKLPMTYEITEYVPNERVVLVGKGDTLEAIDEITFEPREGGSLTLVDYTADLRFQNFIKYVTPLMSPILKRVGERAVDGLVEALDK